MCSFNTPSPGSAPSRATQTPPALMSSVRVDHSGPPSPGCRRAGSSSGARENTRRWPRRMSSISRSTTSSPAGSPIWPRTAWSWPSDSSRRIGLGAGRELVPWLRVEREHDVRPAEADDPAGQALACGRACACTHVQAGDLSLDELRHAGNGHYRGLIGPKRRSCEPPLDGPARGGEAGPSFRGDPGGRRSEAVAPADGGRGDLGKRCGEAAAVARRAGAREPLERPGEHRRAGRPALAQRGELAAGEPVLAVARRARSARARGARRPRSRGAPRRRRARRPPPGRRRRARAHRRRRSAPRRAPASASGRRDARHARGRGHAGHGRPGRSRDARGGAPRRPSPRRVRHGLRPRAAHARARRCGPARRSACPRCLRRRGGRRRSAARCQALAAPAARRLGPGRRGSSPAAMHAASNEPPNGRLAALVDGQRPSR